MSRSISPRAAACSRTGDTTGHCSGVRQQAKCTELATKGLVLGAFEEVVLEELEASLDLGDVLLLYSDGITDAQDPSGNTYGDERLQTALLLVRGKVRPP